VVKRLSQKNEKDYKILRLCLWELWKAFKGMKMALVVVIVAALVTGHSSPLAHISNMLGAATQVTEEAGRAMAGVLGAGADAIESTELAVVSMKNGAANLIAETWSGIELTNVSVSYSNNKIIVADLLHFNQWLEDELSVSVKKLSFLDKALLREALRFLSTEMPHFESGLQNIEFTHLYRDMRIEAKLLSTGYLAVQWLARTVNFSARWTNPIWEILKKDLGQEQSAIKKRIELTMSNMPCPERLWQPLDEDMLRSGKLPPMLWAKSSAWIRWWFLSMRYCGSCVLTVVWWF
jgi:hypothetical protein